MTTRKKKPEAKPTPPVAIDKSETLARAEPTHPFLEHGAPFVLAGRKMVIEDHGPTSFQFQTCPICGTRRASVTTPNNEIRWLDACHVDGHRFEVTK